jgi:lipopolysaccharide assembly outer membrane protein LptD (OstA)
MQFGNLYLDGTAYPFKGARLRFNLGLDPREARLSEGFTAFFWGDARGDRVDLSYRFLRDIPRFFEAFPQENRRYEDFREGVDKINQINGGVRIAITENWGVTYRAAYTFERNLLLANEAGVEYISRCRCWAIRLEVRTSRSRGASVGFEYRIFGLGDDSSAPFESSGTRRFFGLLDSY